MTYHGTNTFLIGDKSVAIIDPGPDHPEHLRAILSAVTSGAAVSHILVTHPHLDHSGLARPLAKATGADIYAFGPPHAGRSNVMQNLEDAGVLNGGEGVDTSFVPDQALADDDVITSEDWSIKAVHLPGHMACHLGFVWEDRLFCGDLLMGWSTSLISPPDGDLDQFLNSLDRLKTSGSHCLYPAHGHKIEHARARIDEVASHLSKRTEQVYNALDETGQNLRDVTARVYTDLSPQFLPYAARNTLAHLIKLHGLGQIRADPEVRENASWSRK